MTRDERIERLARALDLGADADADATPAGGGDLDHEADPAVSRVVDLLSHPGTWAPPPSAPSRPEQPTQAERPSPGPPPPGAPPTGRRPPVRPSGSTAPPSRRDRRGRRIVAWAISITAAASAIAIAIGYVLWPTPPASMTFALSGVDAGAAAQAEVEAVNEPSGWRVTVDVAGLPPAPPDRYYEGWVVKGDRKISIGTFHLREPGEVDLWAGVGIKDYEQLVVTDRAVDDPLDDIGIPVLVGDIPTG